MSRSFAERSVGEALRAADHAVFAEESARSHGLLQAIDARAKLGGFLAMIIAATMSRSLAVTGAMFMIALVLLGASCPRAVGLFARVWGIAFLFTAAVGLPALVLTPGDALGTIPLIEAEVTRQGLRSAAFLLFRVETATTLSLLLVVTTRWATLLTALRNFGVPTIFIVVLGMAYRYIFVLLRTAFELFEGRRSRRVGVLTRSDQRHLMTATAGAMLSKSVQLSDDIYLAMQARGFRGDVRILDQRPMQATDWLALTVFVLIAAAAGILGR